MNHIEHISKYCNDDEILSILQKLGEYLDNLDENKIRIEHRRENKPSWKEAICEDYLIEYKKSIRPGPPWHQKIYDLLLDLETRNRHIEVVKLCADLGKRIGARKQALSSIYPPGGFLAWHHNADVPGRNLIFTWSKTGKGIFRYKRDVPGKASLNYDISDQVGWNVKSFDWFGHKVINHTGYTWHTAGTEDLRCTLAFVIHSNPMSDMLLEEDFNLHSWSNGCFISEDDSQNSSEWWKKNKEEITTMKVRPEIKDNIAIGPTGVKNPKSF